MALPLSIDNVPYYNKSYRGDLIVADRVLYFFPHTDISEDRAKRRDRFTIHRSLLGITIGLILGEAVNVVKIIAGKTTNRCKPRSDGIWRDEDSCPVVQAKLDQRIQELKQEKTVFSAFSTTLPRPERFALNEIQNLSIGPLGKLVFDAHSDKHDFKIGLMRRKKLHEALWEAGFRQGVVPD